MRHSTLASVMLVGLLVWALALACGPRPGTPLPDTPSVRATPNCRNALGGQVTRHVNSKDEAGFREVPIEGLEVSLVDSSGSRVAQTRTDRDGRYGFHDVCSGTYIVCAGPMCPYSPDSPMPRLYEPPSHEVSVPPIVQSGLDFLATEPPPPLPEER